jgi:ABC-type transporter MlaC component
MHKDGTWKTSDVVTDDVSMLENYRNQFNKIIGKEGVPGLIARMKKKLASEQDSN